jgi:glycerol transport system ATP-binding protein
MLELQGVCFAQGDAEPFEHQFLDGSISVVLGGNESGKTDLMRFIAGLTSRYQGHLFLHGDRIDQQRPEQRPVAMVYQAFVNYPHLTVFDNIAAPIRRQKKQVIAAKVGKYAELLSISDLLDRLPDQLSGGQQQRVAIARALAKEARVLVLDEPLVNLDYKLREALTRELKNLLSKSGAIIVYASSEPRDAYFLGGDLLLLDQGQKVQSGQARDVYAAPQTLKALDLMSDPQINHWQTTASVFAVRPDHLHLGEREGGVGFQFTVSGIEKSGRQTLLYGRPNGVTTSQTVWVIRSVDPVDIGPGRVIKVSADAEDIHEFAITGGG